MDFFKENGYDTRSINIFDPAFIDLRFAGKLDEDINIVKVMIKNDHLLYALDIGNIISAKNPHRLNLKHNQNLLSTN